MSDDLGLDLDLRWIMQDLVEAWNHFVQRKEPSSVDVETFRFGINTCQNVLARIQMGRDNEGWN